MLESQICQQQSLQQKISAALFLSEGSIWSFVKIKSIVLAFFLLLLKSALL